MFSILAAQFKNSEIKSLSDLFEKICESPVKPKPTCESLLWTWDWKNYVTEKLSDTELANHSFYNCFQIKKENNQTKLRAKPMPQDRSWYPESGIHLMKENSTFDEPVPVADFRIDKLELPRVYFEILQEDAYATLHGTGYWLLPMCEKIHSLLNIAPIIKNKVTFLGQDICPPD